jgi:uncharacterized protein YraI
VITRAASLLLVLACSANAFASTGPVEIQAGSLNVRTRAWGSVVGVAQRGQRFVVRQERAGWARIDFGGRQAWVSARYVKDVRAHTVSVETSSLNVRSGPSTRYRRVGVISRGQRYVRLDQRDGWSKIQFGRTTAWASNRYLRQVGGISGGLLRQPGTTTPTPTTPTPTTPTPPTPTTPTTPTPTTPTPTTPTPTTPGSGLSAVHKGLNYMGAEIPRKAIYNSIIRRKDPYGDTVTWRGLPWVKGKVSHFGGPRDTGVTSSETGTITGERLRSLNNPLNPSSGTLRARPADYYYVAMRWDYRPHGRTFWRRARIAVTNPANGKTVVVRVVDWGPHTRTRRIVDVSPQTLKDLGLTTDNSALVAFVHPATPLGPLR